MAVLGDGTHAAKAIRGGHGRSPQKSASPGASPSKESAALREKQRKERAPRIGGGKLSRNVDPQTAAGCAVVTMSTVEELRSVVVADSAGGAIALDPAHELERPLYEHLRPEVMTQVPATKPQVAQSWVLTESKDGFRRTRLKQQQQHTLMSNAVKASGTEQGENTMPKASLASPQLKLAEHRPGGYFRSDAVDAIDSMERDRERKRLQAELLSEQIKEREAQKEAEKKLLKEQEMEDERRLEKERCEIAERYQRERDSRAKVVSHYRGVEEKAQVSTLVPATKTQATQTAKSWVSSESKEGFRRTRSKQHSSMANTAKANVIEERESSIPQVSLASPQQKLPEQHRPGGSLRSDAVDAIDSMERDRERKRLQAELLSEQIKEREAQKEAEKRLLKEQEVEDERRLERERREIAERYQRERDSRAKVPHPGAMPSPHADIHPAAEQGLSLASVVQAGVVAPPSPVHALPPQRERSLVPSPFRYPCIRGLSIPHLGPPSIARQAAAPLPEPARMQDYVPVWRPLAVPPIKGGAASPSGDAAHSARCPGRDPIGIHESIQAQSAMLRELHRLGPKPPT